MSHVLLLLQGAVSYALNRNVDFDDLHKPLDEDNIKVWRCDVPWRSDGV
jgi:hypothetical protein